MAEQTSQTESSSPSESVGVLGRLGIHGYQLAAQLLDVLIVLVIMWRWVYRPLVAMMDERTKKIQLGLEQSEQVKEILLNTERERMQVLQEARTSARELMEETQAKAEAMRKEKMSQAKQEIETIVAEAKERINQERAATFHALQKDVADLVVQTTEKMIADTDEKTRRGFLQKTMSLLGR